MTLDGGSQHALRRYLLGTASGAALIGSAPFAYADPPPIDHIYVDAGGQYSMTGGHTALPFLFDVFSPNFKIGVKNGWDARGDVALQSGNWYLTLSANFGRTGTSKAEGFSTKTFTHSLHLRRAHNTTHKYIHSPGAKYDESHVVVDFTLGKDVGLGMFGLDGSSIISLGVRYNHFVGRTRANIHYFTRYNYFTKSGATTGTSTTHHILRKTNQQFVGWGPVLTWKGKAPLEPDFAFAWGLSVAAVVGGRSYETTTENADKSLTRVIIRHREIVSPQFGGYVGLVWQMPDSPLDFTVGYRGDAYFDVIDKGNELFGGKYGNRIIHGPYAQIGWQIE